MKTYNLLSKLSSQNRFKRKLDNFRDGMKRPETFFIYFTVFFGLILIFLVPPFQTPDENIHLYRAYEVSLIKSPDLRWSNTAGSDLPTSIRKTEMATHSVVQAPRTKGSIIFNYDEKYRLHYTKYATQIPLNENEQMFYATSSMPAYNPIPYIPQATIIFLARTIDMPFIGMIYLIRLLNLGLWVAAGYYAIRRLPVRKWAFTGVATLPLVITQMISPGYDMAVIASTVILIALAISVLCKESSVFRTKDYLLLLLSATIMTVAKPVMLVMAALPLLIKNKKFTNKRSESILKKIMLVLMPVFIYLAWSILSGDSGGSNVQSSSMQVQKIISNPAIFFTEVIQLIMLYTSSGNLLMQSLVGNFGWMDAPMSTPLITAGSILIAGILLIGHKEQAVINKTNTILINAISIALIIGVILSMYIFFTQPTEPHIRGVQGRYFIPVFFLGALVWKRKWLEVSVGRYRRIVIVSALTLMIFTLITIVVRYYLPYYTALNAA